MAVGADESYESRPLLGFCAAAVNLPRGDHVRPTFRFGRQAAGGEMMQQCDEPRREHLHSELGRREALEQNIECKLEDET